MDVLNRQLLKAQLSINKNIAEAKLVQVEIFLKAITDIGTLIMIRLQENMLLTEINTLLKQINVIDSGEELKF